jgi:hypothetical protein
MEYTEMQADVAWLLDRMRVFENAVGAAATAQDADQVVTAPLRWVNEWV